MDAKLRICQEESHASAPYDDVQPLDALLPDGYQYTVCEYSKSVEDIRAVLRLHITTEYDAHMWVKKYQEKSLTTLRSEWKTKPTGQKVIFHEQLRCQHRTKPRSESADLKAGSKNTNCPSTLAVTVKRVITNRKSKSKDVHATTLPMTVMLAYNHNHPVNCPDALKHRDVSDEVTKIFCKLYEANHTPATALQAYKYDIYEDQNQDFVLTSADRSVCPDLQWCFRLYYKQFKKNYGEPDGEKMLLHLEKSIDQFNTPDNITVKMAKVGDDICVGLCTDLMKRVHKYVRQSGELAFIDGSGGVDRHGCRVFLMMTHSAAGALPLGVLVTTSETEKVLTEGLLLLKDLFPSEAFFGRQEKGPQVFMTDDSDAERKALHNVYSESTLLLCSFHILQAMWRFLWDAKHKVAKEHRPHLMKLVQRLLYSKTEQDLNSHYDALCMDDTACQYPGFVTYIERLFKRRHAWAHCFRANLPVRGNNTNNFCEAAMKVMKDKIFFRTKAFNVVQLVDFLFTRIEKVYKQKLFDVANNRWKEAVTSRYVSIANWNLQREKIIRISNQEFEVPSQERPNVMYHVNMEFATCTCNMGMNGGPCKHQHMVAKHYGMTSINVHPRNSPNLRRLFYKIATGDNGKVEWFASLHHVDNEEFSVSLDPASLQLEISCSSALQSSQETSPLSMNLPDLDDTSIAAEEVQVINQMDQTDTTREGKEMDQDIDEISRILKQKINGNKSVFKEPVQTFLKNLTQIKTEVSLVSALKTFGKYSGAALSRQNHNGKLIGVQPTAVARKRLQSEDAEVLAVEGQ